MYLLDSPQYSLLMTSSNSTKFNLCALQSHLISILGLLPIRSHSDDIRQWIELFHHLSVEYFVLSFWVYSFGIYNMKKKVDHTSAADVKTGLFWNMLRDNYYWLLRINLKSSIYLHWGPISYQIFNWCPHLDIWTTSYQTTFLWHQPMNRIVPLLFRWTLRHVILIIFCGDQYHGNLRIILELSATPQLHMNQIWPIRRCATWQLRETDGLSKRHSHFMMIT